MEYDLIAPLRYGCLPPSLPFSFSLPLKFLLVPYRFLRRNLVAVDYFQCSFERLPVLQPFRSGFPRIYVWCAAGGKELVAHARKGA
uniref:Uncharacterized protein n=1 Tax=Salix viminalis TaxID=40686 RepID=A0A6N2LPR1_SALVM